MISCVDRPVVNVLDSMITDKTSWFTAQSSAHLLNPPPPSTKHYVDFSVSTSLFHLGILLTMSLPNFHLVDSKLETPHTTFTPWIKLICWASFPKQIKELALNSDPPSSAARHQLASHRPDSANFTKTSSKTSSVLLLSLSWNVLEGIDQFPTQIDHFD